MLIFMSLFLRCVVAEPHPGVPKIRYGTHSLERKSLVHYKAKQITRTATRIYHPVRESQILVPPLRPSDLQMVTRTPQPLHRRRLLRHHFRPLVYLPWIIASAQVTDQWEPKISQKPNTHRCTTATETLCGIHRPKRAMDIIWLMLCTEVIRASLRVASRVRTTAAMTFVAMSGCGKKDADDSCTDIYDFSFHSEDMIIRDGSRTRICSIDFPWLCCFLFLPCGAGPFFPCTIDNFIVVNHYLQVFQMERKVVFGAN